MAVRMFRRRVTGRLVAAADQREDLRQAVSHVAIVPDEATRAEAAARLLRIVAEAVVLQDKAAELMDRIRDREPLADLAPRGGPLATRFFELRRLLPPPADLQMARQCAAVSVVLDHHGMLITMALQMLSMDWSSPAIVDQLERLDGLGAPAQRLDAVYAELAAGQPRGAGPSLA
jgi:hypothetical protein